MVGASGAVGASGVNSSLNADAGLVPASFVAYTTQAVLTPLGSPVTVMGEVELVPLRKPELLAAYGSVAGNR